MLISVMETNFENIIQSDPSTFCKDILMNVINFG